MESPHPTASQHPVTGPAWEGAWSDTPPYEEARKAPITVLDSLDYARIAPDAVYHFGHSGHGDIMFLSGWYPPEHSLRWTFGERSRLRLPAPATNYPVTLSFDVLPLVAGPHLTSQILRININGRRFGGICLSERTQVAVSLDPAIWVETGGLNIEFEHPCCFIPRRVGLSDDSRMLGIAFFAVQYLRPDRIAIGSEPRLLVESPMDGGTTDPHSGTATYTFGVRQAGLSLLKVGWALPEDGMVWSNETSATLELPLLVTNEPILLSLRLVPFVNESGLPYQRVDIVAANHLLGHFDVKEPIFLTIPLPPEITANVSSLVLTFLLPDAARPHDIGGSTDTRLLGISLRGLTVEASPAPYRPLHFRRSDTLRETRELQTFWDNVPDHALTTITSTRLGLPVDRLLSHFESLGSNCEFGMVQRRIGLEVLGLLRFCNAPLSGLLRALEDEFIAATDPNEIGVTTDFRSAEFSLEISRYHMRWHTFMYEKDIEAAELLRQQGVKLAYLRRKFYESLRSSRKIFVLKRKEPLTLAEALPVLRAINQYGRNTLMIVIVAPRRTTPGTIEKLAPGLLCGHIDEFAPEDEVESVATACWTRLCATAWEIVRHGMADKGAVITPGAA